MKSPLEKCSNCGGSVLFINNKCPSCRADKRGEFVVFACPQCSQHIEAPTEGVGMLIGCPTCNHQFAIPEVTILMESSKAEASEISCIESQASGPKVSTADNEGLSGFLFNLNENGRKHFSEFLNHLDTSGAETFGNWLACATSSTVAEAARVLNGATRDSDFVSWWQQRQEAQPKVAGLMSRPLWGGNSEVRDQGIRNMGIGALICIIGTLVTSVTYSAAAQGGGHYIVAYGAIIMGAFQFLAGFFQWLLA